LRAHFSPEKQYRYPVYFITYYTDSERAGDGDPEEPCGSGQAQAGLGPGAHQRRDCAAHQGHAAQHAVSVEFECSQHTLSL